MPAPVTLPWSGAKARVRREQLGLTIGQLAKRCQDNGHDVHLSTISKAEIGTIKPSPGLFKAIVDALGCKSSDLLDAEVAA
jgi:transcriptional regulator with XRE-family HTH domain